MKICKKDKKYLGEYEGYKFQIKFSNKNNSDSVYWIDKSPSGWLNIKEIEEEIMQEYIKFVLNEK